jgi:hypothetical protein
VVVTSVVVVLSVVVVTAVVVVLSVLFEPSSLLQEMMVRLINKISNMCNILYLIFMNLNKLIQ